jgi:hypothetical protein
MNRFFCLATVKQIELGGELWLTARHCRYDIRRQMARTGKDWPQELARNFPVFSLCVSQDKKIVGAGRESTLDGEEVTKRRLPISLGGCTIRKLSLFSRMCKGIELHKGFAHRVLNRSPKRKTNAMPHRGWFLPKNHDR